MSITHLKVGQKLQFSFPPLEPRTFVVTKVTRDEAEMESITGKPGQTYQLSRDQYFPENGYKVPWSRLTIFEIEDENVN